MAARSRSRASSAAFAAVPENVPAVINARTSRICASTFISFGAGVVTRVKAMKFDPQFSH
jgi:hypothetical protein